METVSQEKANPQFQWLGKPFELFILMITNLFLTLVTMGIYTPWARTRFRQYLWGHLAFEGDRAVYSGTGEELFRGWLKLFGLLVVFYIIFFVLFFIPIVGMILGYAAPLVYPVLFAIGIYAGTRYRLSRTELRGVRFGLERGTRDFVWLFIQGVVVSVLTLGIYYPWFKNDVRRFLTEKAYFGTGRFSYTGEGKELFKIYLKGVLLTIVTLGFYFPWFLLEVNKYKTDHTQFQGASFHLSLTGLETFWLCALWFFGMLLTFGLAAPFLIHYTLKKVTPNLALNGSVQWDTILSTAASGNATADAAVDFYDIDLGFA